MDKIGRRNIQRRGMENSTLEGCGALLYSTSTKRYLFLLRNGKKHGGHWGLVGGKIEQGETPVEALHREMLEEINLTTSNKIIPIEKFTSDNGKFVFHTYLIPVEQEFVPTLNHEHRGYCWVPLKDHPRPLHPGVWRSFNFEAVKNKLLTIENIFTNQLQEQNHSDQ